MIRCLSVLLLGVAVVQTGCLTLYSKTEVVRAGESRRPVKFENQQVAETFQTAYKNRTRTVGGSYVGVPFVTLYEKDQKLAEVAAWNDAIQTCDTDQDGLITQVEAAVFSNWPSQ
jgi:predicted GTPase